MTCTPNREREQVSVSECDCEHAKNSKGMSHTRKFNRINLIKLWPFTFEKSPPSSPSSSSSSSSWTANENILWVYSNVVLYTFHGSFFSSFSLLYNQKSRIGIPTFILILIIVILHVMTIFGSISIKWYSSCMYVVWYLFLRLFFSGCLLLLFLYVRLL